MKFRQLFTTVKRAFTFPIDSAAWQAFIRGTDLDIFDPTTAISVNEAWRRSVWVRKCVDSKGKRIAARELKVWRGETEQKNNELLKLFKRPNPYLSGSEFWYLVSAHMDLFGASTWLKDRKGSKVSALWFINPGAISPQFGGKDDRELLAWRVTTRRGTRFVDPLDVAIFREPNPFDVYGWSSPLDAVTYGVTGDIYAQQHNIGFFTLGARPNGVLETDQQLDHKTAQRLLDEFEVRHKAKHRPAILTHGMKWQATQANAADIEFINGRKMNREEILAAFGVPPVEVGLLEYASYANARDQRRMYWESTLVPRINAIGDVLQHDFLNDDDNYSAKHDVSDVEELRESMENLLKSMQILCDHGMPVKQASEYLDLGLLPFDGDDVGLVPINRMPLSDMLNPPEPVSPPEIGVKGKEETPQQVAANAAKGNGGKQQPPPSTPEEQAKQKMFAAIERDLPALVTITRATDYSWLIALLTGDKRELQSVVTPYIREGTKLGIEQINELLGVTWGIDDPRAVAFIQQKALKVTGVNDTTLNELRATLSEGIAAGESIDDLSSRVRSLYNFYSDRDRARMIARTETAQSVNGGRFLVLKGEGVDQHEWLSSRDERVRETHAEEDGHVVAVGETFPVTGCAYPGDVNGPAEEVINCRCVTLPANTSRALDRSGYWERLWSDTSAATRLEKPLARAVKAYFWRQRSRVLRALAEHFEP